jgi:hypothetical protein
MGIKDASGKIRCYDAVASSSLSAGFTPSGQGSFRYTMRQEYPSFIALFRKSSWHLNQMKEKLQILNDLFDQMENGWCHSLRKCIGPFLQE